MNAPFTLIAAIVLSCMANAMGQVESPDLKKSAYQSGASQDQLRGETRRVKDAIAELREEFSGYRSMQGELAMLESAMRDLGTLEEFFIPETATIFKDASRLEDEAQIRRKLVDGSFEQKKTQIILRELADRLFLELHLMVMRNRYYNLALRQATNLRQIRPSADDGDKVATEGAEQLSIAREITAANLALKAMAENSPPLRAKFFADALAKADEGKLEKSAEDAAFTLGKVQRAVPDKPASLATLATLKKVIAALDAGRTEEDRTNELVGRLDKLLTYQNALTDFTPKVTVGNRAGLAQGQGYLSDATDLIQEGIVLIHEEAAHYNDLAHDKSEELFERFELTISNRDVEAVKAVVANQRAVATSLMMARDLLQKKAEALAKEREEKDSALEEFLKDLEKADASEMAEMCEMPQEMRDLIKMLLEAKAKIQKAKAMLKEQKDLKEPREQVDQSGKDLKDANDTAGQLEGIIPQEVIDHVRKAGERNGDAAEKLGSKPEQPGDGEKPGEDQKPGGDPQLGAGAPTAGGDLDQAEAEIDKALDALKKMMCMCMGSGAGQGQGAGMGQGQGQGDGNGGGAEGDGPGKAEGEGPGEQVREGEGNRYGKGKAKRGFNTDSGIKPVEGNERERERDALLLLEKEKPPTDYEQMVDQYIRNLGRGELPAR